jgi:SAM-dependent methyltransferase
MGEKSALKRREKVKEKDRVKDFVKDRYSKIARKGEQCCPACAPYRTNMIERAKSIGYSEEELKSIPAPAIMGLGCGNPTALAELKEGEVVLDLGSGSGIDAFLAAKRVGKTGYVIGIDMTEDMVKRAKEIASHYGYQNVEFRIGEIENLPVEDNSVDVIISNCVINLSLDKLKTYREAFRVLKPGGRMLISDLVTREELPEEVRQSFEAWAGCIAGAMEKREYLDIIERAGFKDVAVLSERDFSTPGMDRRLLGKIISIQVRACK